MSPDRCAACCQVTTILPISLPLVSQQPLMSSDTKEKLKNMSQASKDCENSEVQGKATKNASISTSVDDGHRKRPAPATLPTAKRSSVTKQEKEIMDTATLLGFKAGDRFEVEWQVEVEQPADDSAAPLHTVWWAGTLQEYDGSTLNDTLAIRTLHFDARPDLGFPEPASEDFIFGARDRLFQVQENPDCQLPEMRYRIEGEGDMIIVDNGLPDFIQNALNTALIGAQKKSPHWNRLTPAQQALVASQVAAGKELFTEKLVQLAEEKELQIISADDVRTVWDRMVREFE